RAVLVLVHAEAGGVVHVRPDQQRVVADGVLSREGQRPDGVGGVVRQRRARAGQRDVTAARAGQRQVGQRESGGGERRRGRGGRPGEERRGGDGPRPGGRGDPGGARGGGGREDEP